MFGAPGDGAAAALQRGITIVRAGAPRAIATATAPCTWIWAEAFFGVITVGGLQGGTTTVRLRSPAGSTTARDPSVLNGFGFSFLARMPPTTKSRISTPMTMNGSRMLPGGDAVPAPSESAISLAAARLLRHRAGRSGHARALARQREALVRRLVLVARRLRARRHDQRRDLRVVRKNEPVGLRRPAARRRRRAALRPRALLRGARTARRQEDRARRRRRRRSAGTRGRPAPAALAGLHGDRLGLSALRHDDCVRAGRRLRGARLQRLRLVARRDDHGQVLVLCRDHDLADAGRHQGGRYRVAGGAARGAAAAPAASRQPERRPPHTPPPAPPPPPRNRQPQPHSHLPCSPPPLSAFLPSRPRRKRALPAVR